MLQWTPTEIIQLSYTVLPARTRQDIVNKFNANYGEIGRVLEFGQFVYVLLIHRKYPGLFGAYDIHHVKRGSDIGELRWRALPFNPKDDQKFKIGFDERRYYTYAGLEGTCREAGSKLLNILRTSELVLKEFESDPIFQSFLRMSTPNVDATTKILKEISDYIRRHNRR